MKYYDLELGLQYDFDLQSNSNLMRNLGYCDCVSSQSLLSMVSFQRIYLNSIETLKLIS